MGSLKEVRNRITSVGSTQQITKAMKMVSASKLRRAQDHIVQMRPFANKLKEILENLSSSIGSADGGAYAKVRPANKILLVAFTSNRGLCGAFNSNVIRSIVRLMQGKYEEQNKAGNVKIYCVGKKASDYFSKTSAYIGNSNDLINTSDFDALAALAENIMKEFTKGEYDRVEIVYNQFKNAAVQNVTTEQFLPIQPAVVEVKIKMVQEYIFEPSQSEIVLELIPKSLKIQLYKALLDSVASEHGARMTSMSKATDNAQELLKQLKLSYNKARQASITAEILEIVGGANALGA